MGGPRSPRPLPRQICRTGATTAGRLAAQTGVLSQAALAGSRRTVSLVDGALERVRRLIAKGESVTLRPTGEQYVTGPKRYQADEFFAWRTQALSFLRGTLPPAHTYVQEFERTVMEPEHDHLRAGVGILQALSEDLEGGYLAELRTLLTAEVFTDFLAIAEHLLESGYHFAAASVAGAVLEDALRRCLADHGVKAASNLESLSQIALDKGILTPIVYKQLKVWIDVRNNADHGRFDAVDSAVVASMLRDLPAFLHRDLGMP